MPLFGGGYNGPRAKRFLFVDAGSLKSAMKEFSDRYFGGQELPLNYAALKTALGGPFDRVFYYDAIYTKQAGEDEAVYRVKTAAQREFLAGLAETDGFDVFEGDVRRQRPEAPGQKKVDVAIAVDVLTHTFRGTMDEAALLTSDLDFEPLLRALAQQGMPLLLYHQKHATRELRRAALTRQELTPVILWRLLAMKFLEQNPVPGGMSGSIPPPNGTKLFQWDDRPGHHHAVYKTGEGYVIQRWIDGPNHRTNVSSQNLGRLYLWYEDQWGFKVPAEAPR